MKRGVRSMKNKRAQFFLLVAAIIVTIVVTIGVLLSYSGSRSKKPLVYDISKELSLESGKVIDYGIYNGTDIQKLIKNFTDLYTEYNKERANINWFLIYGNGSDVYSVNYTVQGMGSISLGGARFPVGKLDSESSQKKDVKPGDELSVIVEGQTYTFVVNPGQVFFFVLEEYKGGEKHVVPG